MSRLIKILLLAVAILSRSSSALTADEFTKEIETPYQQAWSTRSRTGSSISERAEFQHRLWQSHEEVARRVVARYQAGGWTAEYAREMKRWCEANGVSCRQQSAATRALIVKGIAEILARSSSPGIRRLLREKRVLTRVRILLDGEGDGGLHRGDGHGFLNLATVPPNELPLIYLHEMLHALDPKVLEASRAYLRGSEASRQTGDELVRWLQAGLDRGLLAEWRAWTPTVRLYLEGRNENLWQKIPRVEEIIAARRSGEALGQTVFRFLDPRFPSPCEGIFATPLVGETLKTLRDEYRAGKRPLAGGKLETLVPYTWP